MKGDSLILESASRNIRCANSHCNFSQRRALLYCALILEDPNLYLDPFVWMRVEHTWRSKFLPTTVAKMCCFAYKNFGYTEGVEIKGKI